MTENCKKALDAGLSISGMTNTMTRIGDKKAVIPAVFKPESRIDTGCRIKSGMTAKTGHRL